MALDAWVVQTCHSLCGRDGRVSLLPCFGTGWLVVRARLGGSASQQTVVFTTTASLPGLASKKAELVETWWQSGAGWGCKLGSLKPFS